ncbi:unnamed protein product [Arabidopsis lyrata]|nr:unnamed protein product [Arabidopsis lyrata]
MSGIPKIESCLSGKELEEADDIVILPEEDNSSQIARYKHSLVGIKVEEAYTLCWLLYQNKTSGVCEDCSVGLSPRRSADGGLNEIGESRDPPIVHSSSRAQPSWCSHLPMMVLTSQPFACTLRFSHEKSRIPPGKHYERNGGAESSQRVPPADVQSCGDPDSVQTIAGSTMLQFAKTNYTT